jgi:hypothetical protein
MPKRLPDLHGDRLNAWQEPTNEPAIDPQQPISLARGVVVVAR